MKIYSNLITEPGVRATFTRARQEHNADIWIDDVRSFKPRTHTHGVEVWAYSFDGNRPKAHRRIGSYDLSDELRAASWDDWGFVIALLFRIDPEARVGFYKNQADFISQVQQDGPRRKSDLAFLGLLDVKEGTWS